MPTASTLPDAPSIASRTSPTAETTVSSTAAWSTARAGRVARWCTFNAGSTAPARSFVPPRSTPITQPVATIGHHTGLHAAARRARGAARVPRLPLPQAAVSQARGQRCDELARLRGDAARAPGHRPSRTASPAPSAAASSSRAARRPAARRWTRGRIVRWVLLARRRLDRALGARLPRQRADPAGQGLRRQPACSAAPAIPLTSPNNILVLGSDVRTQRERRARRADDRQRAARTRSCSCASAAARTARMSIARDTVVDIPGAGRQKINAAYAIGGTVARRADDRGLHRGSTSTT